MKLIEDFDMPNFTRKIWVSREAREKWEPRIKKAGKAYSTLEWASVSEGLRKCCRFPIKVQNYEKQVSFYSKKGLYFLPLNQYKTGDGFSHRLREEDLESENPDHVVGVLARNVEDAREFAEAAQQQDAKKQGEMMGYPECCQDFFNRVWSQGYFDAVWQEALETAEITEENEEQKIIELEDNYDPLLFTGLRYLNLRLLPFWPCSFDCSRAKKVAGKFQDLGRDLEPEGTKYLTEILSWPTEWSCLKGIALVSTPLFRVSTSSLPCYPEHAVRLAGRSWPELGPEGLEFPWDSKLAEESHTSDVS